MSLRGEPLPSLAFWLAPMVGTAIWPWLFLLLDRYRGVMRQRSAT
jgi:cell shape-determining protein MreD